MLKSNGVWWFALLGIFLFGIVGLGIGQKVGFDKGYDRGYYDGLYAEPVVVTANSSALGYSGYINFDNDSLEDGKSFTVTTPQDNSQSELSQQIMDILGEASKVDISIKGDKVNGGIIDIHLEFDK